MTLWVLDTDCISLFQQGHPNLTQRISAVNPEEIAVTIITVEEQLRGRFHVIRQTHSSEKLVLAYARLRATLEYFQTICQLDFDRKAYDCYTELIRQKVRIGTQDLRIAAIVISRNSILVTRNQRDFSRVPNLRFEDWTLDESNSGN